MAELLRVFGSPYLRAARVPRIQARGAFFLAGLLGEQRLWPECGERWVTLGQSWRIAGV